MEMFASFTLQMYTLYLGKDHVALQVHFLHTPPKINMEPGNDGFPIGISFSKGPFSGSMFVFGGVSLLPRQFFQMYDFWFVFSGRS